MVSGHKEVVGPALTLESLKPSQVSSDRERRKFRSVRDRREVLIAVGRPKTQDEVGRLMATTGTVSEHMITTHIPLGFAVIRHKWALGQLGVESSPARPGQCTWAVGDAYTLLHPQFFNADAFESQSLTEEGREANTGTWLADWTVQGLCR